MHTRWPMMKIRPCLSRQPGCDEEKCGWVIEAIQVVADGGGDGGGDDAMTNSSWMNPFFHP